MGIVVDLRAYRTLHLPAVAITDAAPANEASEVSPARAALDMTNGIDRMRMASALLAEAIAECRALAISDAAQDLP